MSTCFLKFGARLLSALAAAGLCCFGATIAKSENGVGRWGGLGQWPLIPLHAMLLPDGRVMSYGTNATARRPATSSTISGARRWAWPTRLPPHWTLPNTTATDLFCSAQIILPQTGDVALLGGDVWNRPATTNCGNTTSNVFTPPRRTPLTRGANMHQARWYATATTLPNGDIYIQGGKGRRPASSSESATRHGNFRLLSGADTSTLYWWYPRNWVAPDGRIFGFSDRTMYYVNPRAPARYAGRVTLPVERAERRTSSEVMFAPGRILRVGGGALATRTRPAARRRVIDINGSAPVRHPGRHRCPLGCIGPMPRWCRTAGWWSPAAARTTCWSGSTTTRLDLDPANARRRTVGARTRAATARHARLYHSIGMLLPDASILVGGGGACRPRQSTTPTRSSTTRPICLRPAGQFAPRPRIIRRPTPDHRQQLRHAVAARRASAA